ncbi:hypothetical protein TWF594_011863 [Orbilia oligospora]|nr:hypothetical protein TWF103_012023 [Orbilia oligospora]KAF3146291.1 hypothetical protein TWF594_011863 [Orbilia oligospora]KAF3176770.1 hypothetical protein TWF751_012120 [Orbilia oligospora]
MRSRKFKNVSRVKRSPQSKHGKLDAKLAQYSEKYGAVGQPLCHKWLEASQSQPHAAITSQRPAMGWMSHRFAGRGCRTYLFLRASLDSNKSGSSKVSHIDSPIGFFCK